MPTSVCWLCVHGHSGCQWLCRGGCCCRAAQLEGGKQVPNRSRPTRNKTKKVIGGATDEEIAEHAARPRMPRPAAVRQLQRNRSKGKNGKMRVGSKHINDAAEALLGMGSGFVDDDTLVCFLLLLLLYGSGTSYLPYYDVLLYVISRVHSICGDACDIRSFSCDLC